MEEPKKTKLFYEGKSQLSREEGRAELLKPEVNLVWPTKKNVPMPDPEHRFLYYLNQHGKQAVVCELNAPQIHNRMKEFHGDQNGDMTPPRNITKIQFGKGGVQYK